MFVGAPKMLTYHWLIRKLIELLLGCSVDAEVSISRTFAEI